MADFVVSARKYRPIRFADVVGQGAVTTTLRNAIASGQLAHSFLFCGPRGVGKTTCARILAQAINCERPVDGVEPCGECGPCTSFKENSSFNIYEIDAASNNSVEDIRTLTDQVRFPPQAGKYKVYIIDEVHMLSTAAFNAFLKTLEEPPPYAIFILATTEKHKIIPTILSRCQIFDFSRISVDAMTEHLEGIAKAEKVAYAEDGLRVIAQKADGGLRDALSMFDRILAFSGGKLALADVLENLNILDYDVFFQLVDDLLAEDLAAALQGYAGVLERGFEGDVYLTGLAEHMRNLLVARDPAMHSLLEANGALRDRYLAQAAIIPASFLVSALSILNQADIQYKTSRNKRLHVEMTLVKLTYLQRSLDLSQAGTAGREKAAPAAAATKKKQRPEPANEESGGQAAPEVAPAVVAPKAAPEAEAKAAPKAIPATAPAAGPEAAPAAPAAPAPSAKKPAPSAAPDAAKAVATAQTALLSPSAEAEKPEAKPAKGPAPKSQPGEVASAQTEPAPAPAKKPAASKKPAQPTPPGVTSPVGVAGGIKIPSLTDLAQELDAEHAAKEAAKEQAAIAEGPSHIRPIDLPALQSAWKAHAAALVKDKEMSTAKLMEAASLEEGRPGELVVRVDNGIQQQLLRDALPAYRERAVAAGLVINQVAFALHESGEEDAPAVPYTSQDRLTRMAEKNPLLHNLRDKLGLELDY